MRNEKAVCHGGKRLGKKSLIRLDSCGNSREDGGDFHAELACFRLPFAERFAGEFDAIGDVFLELLEGRGERFEACFQGSDDGIAPLCLGLAANFFEFDFRFATSFDHFCEDDACFGNAAEIVGETEFREKPDCPFGGVEVPAFYAVAVVVLKLVVIVVIAFAEGEERHDEAVTGTATGGVGLIADGVAKGIDEERALLNREHAEHTSKEETAEGARPAAVDEISENGGKDETYAEGDELIPAVLPHDEAIFAQVVDVV